MRENLKPNFVKNNENPQLAVGSLSDDETYKFNMMKSRIHDNDGQDLIDGINIMNRETISEVSRLMNNSSSVKLYSSNFYENILKNFCNRLLSMGIKASFYDINEDKNTETICFNDLAIVNNFKSEKDLCNNVLTTLKKKYAKTVSINQENMNNDNADYNIRTFDLRGKNDSEIVKSVLDCLSFAAFSNKSTCSSGTTKNYKSSTLLN